MDVATIERPAFHTLEQIKRANDRHGNHWFSADSMRFFRGKCSEKIIAGRYFVSSEQYSSDSKRLYTIRCALNSGAIETVGQFQGYESQREAEKDLREMLAGRSNWPEGFDPPVEGELSAELRTAAERLRSAEHALGHARQLIEDYGGVGARERAESAIESVTVALRAL